eukprot:TRINITY_DN11765_c0_g1_i3.p1 TRINITY_DN11765_c0_g1~~TRINITY_DN11765_c0_g1_i3.p1  ORF type:complete len:157 (-),score=57.92 TRINITY_DN11765_c0_g1_i3:130-600(-)
MCIRDRSTWEDKLARQAKVIDNSLTDEQIEEIVNDPQGTEKLLQAKLDGQGHAKLQNAVSDIQDKYRDIQKLEASVELVFKMFQDLALLVHEQGEALDCIEMNINQANYHVKEAEKHLRDAKQEHQSGQKKMCFLVILLLCIIAGVIVYLKFTRII